MLRIYSRKSQREDCAVEIDDQIGWAMRVLRSCEQWRSGVVERCRRAYPKLAEFIPKKPVYAIVDSDLNSLRNHITSLYEKNCAKMLRELMDDEEGLGPDVVQSRKVSIQRKLQKLVPGTSASPSATLTLDGRIVTDTDEMANALRSHWQYIFSNKPVNEELLYE